MFLIPRPESKSFSVYPILSAGVQVAESLGTVGFLNLVYSTKLFLAPQTSHTFLTYETGDRLFYFRVLENSVLPIG